MTNTQFLSRYLTEIILAKFVSSIYHKLCRLRVLCVFSYLESCSDALRLLYEELMLPLPVQLSSPTLDTSYATSDGESPFCSVSKPRVSASTAEDNARFPIIYMALFHIHTSSVSVCSSRKLKRFRSFHGFPAAKKQITVPVEKKQKKATKVLNNYFKFYG